MIGSTHDCMCLHLTPIAGSLTEYLTPKSQAHFAETSKPLLVMAYVEEMVEQKEDSTNYVAQPPTYVAPQQREWQKEKSLG